MANTKQHETRSTLASTSEIADEESRLFWNWSPSLPEQSRVLLEKCLVPSSRTSKLSHYTPPDSLMFPLLSAIQNKSWTRAKRLCHELILCDPTRQIYCDLYVRLDQITYMMKRQPHSVSMVSSSTTANDIDESSNPQQSS